MSSTGSTVLLFACSGGANVAEVADRAARTLMSEGVGAMFCLAGLGAGFEPMIQQARQAKLNVIIDGCEKDCARAIFQKHGLTNTMVVRVTDCGLTKGPKGMRATDSEVATVVTRVRQALATV